MIIKNKRGDATSLIIAVVILFTIGVIVMMFSKPFGEMIDILQNDPTFSANPNSVETLNVVESNYVNWLDYFFLFSFIATIIGLVISSIFIDVHPGFMIFFIIILVITIIFGALFANVFVTIGETDTMSSTYSQFVMTSKIMNNLPWILFIIGLIVVIVLYGKNKSVGGPM